jgi:hypothetical protein
MSEADRVFARMTTPGSHPASEDTQLLHITSRRRGAVAGQSRTVEVVHRRSDRGTTSSDAALPPTSSAHAATWPEGFPARPAPIPPPVDSPGAIPEPASAQVGHVVSGWKPLLAPLQPDEPATKPTASPRHLPHAVTPKAERRFADPFLAEDTGANCFRCGYLVEPARESRGLMTCAGCG